MLKILIAQKCFKAIKIPICLKLSYSHRSPPFTHQKIPMNHDNYSTARRVIQQRIPGRI
jgi:hypothetical protein